MLQMIVKRFSLREGSRSSVEILEGKRFPGLRLRQRRFLEYVGSHQMMFLCSSLS